ncbi:GntR family transcriptional regulator [Dongia soli]|uniref:GntR family transcriptional regulator n=1 Tax=Dongia soli TaxID=600628 RepID=A0ABU5E5D1_9PROT|nr:GntR family transcriptional regulator [Dongia soli]MDY0881487.1 GntR family transcriptional regulator [Dongia soli]
MARRVSTGDAAGTSEDQKRPTNFMAASAAETSAGESAFSRPGGLASNVYEVILGQMMSLKISPGARITVDALVRELNVSHTPIREALNRLEADGLVVKTHLIGYSAAPQLTRRQFDELYELRLLLEPFAARKAAIAMDEKAIGKLAEIADRMTQKKGDDDARARYNQFARQDAAFHDHIIIGSGNELFRESLARLHIHFHIFRLMFHSRVTEEAIEEHARIIEALKSGDGDAAALAMTRHIQRSRDRLLPAFR